MNHFNKFKYRWQVSLYSTNKIETASRQSLQYSTQLILR